MFTGGEPVLAVDLMEFALEACQMMGIKVGNFWMATNGLIHTKRVQNAIRKWLDYTDDGEINGIRISIDPYHDPINLNYWREFEEDLKNEGINVYFEFFGAPKDVMNLISGGRAEESGWGTRSIKHDIMLYDKGNEFEYIEGVTYINYRGDLISTCDISFNLQDEEDSDFNLGNVYKQSLESMYNEFFDRHPELVN
jgi:MoaA/NifB/PqqE/SkfB family radical SAM enzyme